MSVIAIYHILNIMNMNLDRNQTKRQEIKIPATFGPKKRERWKRKEEDKKKLRIGKTFVKVSIFFVIPSLSLFRFVCGHKTFLVVLFIFSVLCVSFSYFLYVYVINNL